MYNNFLFIYIYIYTYVHIYYIFRARSSDYYINNWHSLRITTLIRISYHAVIVVGSIKSNSRRKCTQTTPASKAATFRYAILLFKRPAENNYALVIVERRGNRYPTDYSNVIIEKNNSRTLTRSIFFKKLNKVAANWAWHLKGEEEGLVEKIFLFQNCRRST